MPLYDKPAGEGYQDSIADFSKSTLQKEQDFHVGLRSEIREAYLKFGVESTVYVSSPSPSTLKHENMSDCVINNIPDNQPSLDQANIDSPSLCDPPAAESPAEPISNINHNSVESAAESAPTESSALDNSDPVSQPSIENVAQELVALVTRSNLLLEESDPNIETTAETDIEKSLTVEDVTEPTVGESVSEQLSAAANDESVNESKIDVTSVFEASDSYSEEAAPVENNAAEYVETVPVENEAKEELVPVENEAKEELVVEDVTTSTPQAEVLAVEPLLEDEVTQAVEALVDAVLPEEVAEVPEVSPAESSQVEEGLREAMEVALASKEGEVEVVQEPVGQSPTPIEETESTTEDSTVEEQKSKSIAETPSTVGMTNSGIMSEIFKNTDGIEEGLREAVEVAAKEAEIEAAETKVAAEAVETTEEAVENATEGEENAYEAPAITEVSEVAEESMGVVDVQTTDVIEECSPTEDENKDQSKIDVTSVFEASDSYSAVAEAAPAENSAPTFSEPSPAIPEPSPPVPEPSQTVPEASPAESLAPAGLGNNLMGVEISVLTPSSRNVAAEDWVVEDCAVKEEQTQDLKIEASSQTEISVDKEESVSSVEVLSDKSKESITATIATATTATTAATPTTAANSAGVRAKSAGSSPAEAPAPDKAPELDHVIAQYTSQLEDQQTYLRKSLSDQARIEEELHVYKKRNIGLEERYQFTVQQLAQQKEINDVTRNEHQHTVTQLRDAEYKLREADQSITLLKHKQIELQRQKSKLCVIL